MTKAYVENDLLTEALGRMRVGGFGIYQLADSHVCFPQRCFGFANVYATLRQGGISLEAKGIDKSNIGQRTALSNSVFPDVDALEHFLRKVDRVRGMSEGHNTNFGLV